MPSSTSETADPRARAVTIGDDDLTLELFDGRTISVPLAWYPRLLHGSPEERARFELFGDGSYIHWPDLDEDLTVEGIVTGRRSAESPASLKRWLASREHTVPGS